MNEDNELTNAVCDITGSILNKNVKQDCEDIIKEKIIIDEFKIKERNRHRKYYRENIIKERERLKISSQKRRSNLTDEQRIRRNQKQREYNLKNNYKVSTWKREYNLKNKDKKYQQYIKHRYGITIDIINELLLKQNNKCAICNVEFQGSYHRNIDHDHNNGKIRQLLCRKCNRGLGCFLDNEILLQNATDYIKKWKFNS
jgi:hypothetical protein